MSIEQAAKSILHQVNLRGCEGSNKKVESITVDFGPFATSEDMNAFDKAFKDAAVGTAAEKARIKRTQTTSVDLFANDIYLDEVTFE